MRVKFHDIEAEYIPQDRLTTGEVDAVEKVTGLTLQRIRRMSEQCVCEHGRKAHEHKGDDGEVVDDDRSCTECDCGKHQPDLPTKVSTAYVWVSLRRVDMSLKFADILAAPIADLQAVAEPEDDATVDPPAAP